MKKLALLILGFIAYNSTETLHAYSWPIVNNTSKTLLIQLELTNSANAFFNIARPGQEVDFSWSFGNAMAYYSLSKIKYIVVDDYLLQNADFLTKDKSAVTNPRTALDWLNKPENIKRYPRICPLVGVRHVQADGKVGRVCFFDGNITDKSGLKINYSCPFSLVERQEKGNTIICAERITQSLKDLWCLHGTGVPASN